MGQDQPDIPEIIKTVKEFIDDMLDKVDKAERYNALCASHLLGVAQRELELGTQQCEEQRRRLANFTGEHGSLDTLIEMLCKGIRAGRYDDRWNEAFDLILQDLIDRVKVSRPDYLDDVHRD
jgi:hypothetical protein